MSGAAKAKVFKVETVALPVTDQDRAVEFYVGQLGFDSLRAGGVDTDPAIMRLGGPAMFSFPDPDGNSLLIVESTGSQ